MNVTFDAAERGDLRQYRSGSSTLNNNTPALSRDPSAERRKDEEITTDLRSIVIQPRRKYLQEELDVDWMGGVIIVCFFTSGLIDAVAFTSWNCFVGMQTGNTVFAALGIGGLPASSHRQQYYKSLVAIASFCVGTLFFNLLHRWHTGLAQTSSMRRRWVFVVSFIFQTLCIVAAAVLVQAGAVSNEPFITGSFSSGSHAIVYDGRPRYLDLLPIAILSFEAAGQVCLSRVLSVIELPTIVLSTLYHDFTADVYGTRQLWKNSSSVKDFVLVQARRQEKRLFSILALACGAFVGGEMYKRSPGMAGALWLAVGLKTSVAVAFAVWKPQPAEPILPQ